MSNSTLTAAKAVVAPVATPAAAGSSGNVSGALAAHALLRALAVPSPDERALGFESNTWLLAAELSNRALLSNGTFKSDTDFDFWLTISAFITANAKGHHVTADEFNPIDWLAAADGVGAKAQEAAQRLGLTRTGEDATTAQPLADYEQKLEKAERELYESDMRVQKAGARALIAIAECMQACQYRENEGYDYREADEVVARVLDKYSNNIGFRMALANFFLWHRVWPEIDVIGMDPERLLTHGGQRNREADSAAPMAEVPAGSVAKPTSAATVDRMVAGAEIFRDMMLGLEGIEYVKADIKTPVVEGDDCMRMDYAKADALVSAALKTALELEDLGEMGRGFIAALANYVMNLRNCGQLTLEKCDPESLLMDFGYRNETAGDITAISGRTASAPADAESVGAESLTHGRQPANGAASEAPESESAEIDSDMLLGAYAFKLMVEDLEAAEMIEGPANPAWEGDDGLRHDYKLADAAVAEAFSTIFGDSAISGPRQRGFMTALANHFLGSKDVHIAMEAVSSQDLLTDHRFRPVKDYSPNSEASAPQAANPGRLHPEWRQYLQEFARRAGEEHRASASSATTEKSAALLKQTTGYQFDPFDIFHLVGLAKDLLDDINVDERDRTWDLVARVGFLLSALNTMLDQAIAGPTSLCATVRKGA